MRLLANGLTQQIGSIVYRDNGGGGGGNRFNNSANGNGKCIREPPLPRHSRQSTTMPAIVGKASRVLTALTTASHEQIATDGASTLQVYPVLVRKTPKFPSRERHMAIRRKKPTPTHQPVMAAPNTATCGCADLDAMGSNGNVGQIKM